MDKTEKLGQECAFPLTGDVAIDDQGISRRLYIATKITQGMLSNPKIRNALLMDSKNKYLNPKSISPAGYLVKYAYEHTDELLKQENE